MKHGILGPHFRLELLCFAEISGVAPLFTTHMVSRVQQLYKCMGKSKNEMRPCCQKWIFSLQAQYSKKLNKSVLMLTKILGCFEKKNFFFQKNVLCISVNPTKKTELKKLHPIKSYRLWTEKGEICFFSKHTGFCVSGDKIHLKCLFVEWL